MEFDPDIEKPLDFSSIQVPKPQRFCTPGYSPFSQSLLTLSPIPTHLPTPTLYFHPISPDLSFRQLTLISPLEPETPKPTKRIIQKIDFSQYLDSWGKIKSNSLPVEIKVFQDDAFEHSNLLTSLSKSKPQKRSRNVENIKLGCTCPKSKCLKLYCECFARQIYCESCNCVDCHNISEFEEIRKEAISATLERNPNAFTPKIASGQSNSAHSKGCHCSKSGCLKNYCECFQSGVACGEICQCIGCKNSEGAKKKRKKQTV